MFTYTVISSVSPTGLTDMLTCYADMCSLRRLASGIIDIYGMLFKCPKRSCLCTHCYKLQNFRTRNWILISWWSPSCFQNIRPHPHIPFSEIIPVGLQFKRDLTALGPRSKYSIIKHFTPWKIDIFTTWFVYWRKQIHTCTMYHVRVSIYRLSEEGRSIFWEVIVSVIIKQKVYMYMCSVTNGFRDRAISLYSSKIVDMREILRTVSNTGIYC
jgi:hypothetical protein